MHSSNKKAFFGNIVLEVCEEVYEPAEDSFLFAENLSIKKGSRVLDVGTGTGLLGILAAKDAADVVSIDLNPFAVACAKKNAERNGVQCRISFIQSDLFAALRKQKTFDYILFNSPYLPSEIGEDASWIGRAWAGGRTGRQIIDKFLSQAPFYLKEKGRILLLQSSLSNIEETIGNFSLQNFCSSVLASIDLPFFERLVLIEAIRKQQ